MPVFPPTPQGAAAAASFMAHFNNATINAAAGKGPNPIPQGPPQGPQMFNNASSAGGFMPPQQQQPPISVAPGNPGAGPNPALAAAMAALLSNAGRNVPSQEILGSLLGAASGGGSGGNMGGNPMVGGGGAGFPMGGSPGMNPLGQLMSLQGGMGAGQNGPAGGFAAGGNMGSERPRDSTATLQQLLMAAAAGGMSQDQIAQAAATLGLNRVSHRFFTLFKFIRDSFNFTF